MLFRSLPPPHWCLPRESRLQRSRHQEALHGSLPGGAQGRGYESLVRGCQELLKTPIEAKISQNIHVFMQSEKLLSVKHALWFSVCF